jgi:hypothetical protein
MADMQSFIIGIVIVGITLVIGIYVSATMATTFMVDNGSGTLINTASSNAANSLVTALSGGSAWITILVVVGFAVIVLGMLSEGLGKAASSAGPVY